MSDRHDDPSRYPALGRLVHGLVDGTARVNRIVYGLYALCAALFAADFLYHKHVELGVEKFPGFYALYGFVMCAGLVISAKGLRLIVKRREDYYAPLDVEAEDYPADQLEKVDNDG